MRSHPITKLFPMMTDEEFAELKADIKESGQHEPIWTYQDQIIDGRNRAKACRELKITPKIRKWDGKGSLVKFVVSLNLHRRHLNSDQRAMVAVDMLPALEKEAEAALKAGQKKGGETAGRSRPKINSSGAKSPQSNQREPRARDIAAASTNVSPRRVQDAKLVQKKAPEVAKQVRDGELTLAQAKRHVQRAEKTQTLEKKAATAKRAIAKDKKAGKLPWKIINGDCVEELTKLKDVRLIFADPPYNIGIDYGPGKKADSLPLDQYLNWCRVWINRCATILTSDGSFWLMVPDEYAEHFAIMMNDAGLTRRAWIKWYETFGQNCQNNFNRCTRHIFYYVASPKKYIFNRDAVTRPSDRATKYKDKRADPGGKIWDDMWSIPRLTDGSNERLPGFPTQVPLEITRAIVGCASEPGDLVVDPFSGSASLGHAATELGRRFVGIEKEKKFCNLATKRLEGVSI